MSSLVITLSITGAVAVLIIIAYLNQLAESNRRRKARLKADIADRYRRLAALNEQFAGQLMTPSLKLLLSRWQLHFAEQLLNVDRHDSTYRAIATELRKQIDRGADIAIQNPPQPVTSDAHAKHLRGHLELLHGQVIRATQIGLLTEGETKHWIQEIRNMLAQVYIELYGTQAKQALQGKQPGQARLALERGVQFLQKQGADARYQTKLMQFQKLLTRVNSLLLNGDSQGDEESSELNEGLKSLDDDGWKKKALYD